MEIQNGNHTSDRTAGVTGSFVRIGKEGGDESVSLECTLASAFEQLACLQNKTLCSGGRSQ